ncbi:lamin tail domain-containing protein [Gemmatimonas aurantiaca]|nr:lamin tail domain-containing protein [Gemmatimonas aurantiaca]
MKCNCLKECLVSVTSCFALTCTLAGQVLVNEALVNEPSGTVSAEWIELYNTDSAGVWLNNFVLSVNGSTQSLPNGHFLKSGEYLILARDSLRFESLWGDGSGEWGDNLALENYPMLEISFQLVNSAGFVTLLSPLGDSSLLNWSGSGADGVSWERGTVDTDDAQACQDISGATQGRRNSVTPVARDLAVTRLSLVEINQERQLCVTIVNNGSENADTIVEFTTLRMLTNLLFDSSMSPSLQGDVFFEQTFQVPTVSDSLVVCGRISEPDYYVAVGAVVVFIADEIPENDYLIATVPGDLFPAIIINEFLANPTTGGSGEWIELKNVSSAEFELGGWKIGDAANLSGIDSGLIALSGGEYVVLAQDRNAFLSYYTDFNGTVVENTPWGTLNNNGDVVRLVDVFGYLSDSVEYADVWSDNVTWARIEDEIGLGAFGDWGHSTVSGGSPGAVNDAVLAPLGSAIAVSVSPNPFSPDGDGISDVTTITVNAALGGEMRIEIFAALGSSVRKLFVGEPFSGAIIWDGNTDSGGRAPIGIYIIYIEIDGTSTKTTVVIAR